MEPSAGSTSDTGRLETFADGVMAIAITLLVLEIRVPTHQPGRLGHALLEQWPSYAAYVTSFLTIGVIWVNHHRMFKLIERVTHSFLMLNVLFLMVVSFIPFPTALVAAAIKDHDGVRASTLVYGGTMLLLAIMFNLVWGYASAGHRLLVPGLDPVRPARNAELPEGPPPLRDPDATGRVRSIHQPRRLRHPGGILVAPQRRPGRLTLTLSCKALRGAASGERRSHQGAQAGPWSPRPPA